MCPSSSSSSSSSSFSSSSCMFTDLTPLPAHPQLEASCHDYQVMVDRLQKEVLHLHEQLENRDHAIVELNQELDKAKEDVARM